MFWKVFHDLDGEDKKKFLREFPIAPISGLYFLLPQEKSRPRPLVCSLASTARKEEEKCWQGQREGLEKTHSPLALNDLEHQGAGPSAFFLT